MLSFDFRHVSELHELPNDGCQVPRSGQTRGASQQRMVPGRNQGMMVPSTCHCYMEAESPTSSQMDLASIQFVVVNANGGRKAIAFMSLFVFIICEGVFYFHLGDFDLCILSSFKPCFAYLFMISFFHFSTLSCSCRTRKSGTVEVQDFRDLIQRILTSQLLSQYTHIFSYFEFLSNLVCECVSTSLETQENEKRVNCSLFLHYDFVEAKLHGESKVILRCFDDNNDDNKR